MKILIVDDDAMVAEALSDILTTLGHEARSVNRGDEALSAIEAATPELVILDLELPGMPGTAVAGLISERYAGIGIIYSSGFSEQEGHIDRMAPCFRGFIRKPFEISDIKAAIEKARC